MVPLYYRDTAIRKRWGQDAIVSGVQFWRNWPGIFAFWPTCVFRWKKLAQIGFIDSTIVGGSDSLLLLELALMGDVALLSSVAVEDGYNKSESYYSSFYENPWQVFSEHGKYYRRVADFATLRGVYSVSKEEAETWYLLRVSALAVEQASKCKNEESCAEFWHKVNRFDARICEQAVLRIQKIAKK